LQAQAGGHARADSGITRSQVCSRIGRFSRFGTSFYGRHNETIRLEITFSH
jgi:hypothetical protein